MSDDNIFKMVDMLTQVAMRSIDHYMARIRREADRAGQPVAGFVPRFLDAQWHRVLRLIAAATPFPDAQAKAAELALNIDSLAGAAGRFAEWLPVVEGLAVAMDHPGTENRLQLAHLWACVARCYQYAGDMNRAGVSLTTAEGHTANQGEAGEDLARALRLTKGGVRTRQLRYEEAEALYRQLLADAEASGDSQTAIFGHDLAAYYSLSTLQPVRAFDHAQQVFVLAIALCDSVKRLRGLHCMAEALRIGKRLGQAEDYLKRAYKLALELNDQPWLAYLEYSFGTLAVEAEDYPKAIIQLKKARGLFQDTSNRPGEVNSIESLGFALMQDGQYGEAEPVLLEAIRGLKEIHNPFELAQVYYALGTVYARQKRRIQARDAWYEALHQLDGLPVESGHVLGLLEKLQDAVAEEMVE